MSSLAETRQRRNRIHPQMFGLWVAFASIAMMFGSLTSAYIVRRGAGNWLEFVLPIEFLISTAVIILSSICLHISYLSFKKGNEKNYKLYLIFSFLLGIAFVFTQYLGWTSMYQMGIYLTGNPSGSFIYVISALHALHILGGMAALVMAMVYAFKLPYYYSETRLLRFQMVNQYWHFMGAVWIYLFLFFNVQ